MSDRPRVSVITATYNMAHYLAEAIESVLNQTHTDLQHVIIDDGSQDDTRELVKRYLGDPRLEYHYQENRGQTVAKNHGLRKARGEFICFLDADNIYTLDKLDKQLAAFGEIPPERKVLYTHQVYIDGDGERVFTPEIERHYGQISAPLLFNNFVTFNTVMVRRECFDELGGFDERLPRAIDYELWLRFSTRFQFHYLPDVTVYYRKWEGQMTQDERETFRYGLEIMRRFIDQHPDLIDRRTARSAWSHAMAIRGRYEAACARYPSAIRHLARALRYDPRNKLAWKSILMMLREPFRAAMSEAKPV